jgi:putative spermidine/putrescine transport system substrate-binding protein
MSGAPRFRSALFVVLLLLAGALVPLAGADAQPNTLVVTGYGGRWSEVMKKALVEPFEKKHNVKVEVVTGISTEWVAKLMAAGPDNPPFDVLFGNEPAFPIPRERGFFDKRNDTLAPNIKNLYPKALIGDTSLAMFWGRIGLAYRTDMGLKRPTSWKDFWDEAYVGKRATYVIGNTLGINFLFMVSKIFGKDYFDIDAGVAAIKRAQPKLVDFTGTVEKQLEQKEVVMAVLHDASTYDLQKRGIPVDWAAPSEGLPILDQIVQVTKGSKNKELAWKFIDAYISPEVQLAFATELFWSPTNKTVKVPADVAKKIISGPADVDKLVLFDWAQVAKQRPQWTEKWNKEMR